MNRLQKQAWSNLSGIAVFCPIFTAVWVFVDIKLNGKTFSAELATQGFVISAFVTFIGAALQASRVFRVSKKDGEILFDERDQFINHRAIRYTYYAICVLLFLALTYYWPSTADNTVVLIPRYVLSLCLSIIALIVILVYSVAVLVQYGWGDKNGK